MQKPKTRICCKCKIEKELTEYVKDKYDPTGYTYQCKLCRREKQREWVAANPEKVKSLNKKHRETRKAYYQDPVRKLKYRKKFIERSFNIPYEQYEKMQIEQNNKCAICDHEQNSHNRKYLAVDHCHETGKIRGLLCSYCNNGLGLFKDDIELFKKAIEYLIKHK